MTKVDDTMVFFGDARTNEGQTGFHSECCQN